VPQNVSTASPVAAGITASPSVRTFSVASGFSRKRNWSGFLIPDMYIESERIQLLIFHSIFHLPVVVSQVFVCSTVTSGGSAYAGVPRTMVVPATAATHVAAIDHQRREVLDLGTLVSTPGATLG
jgi:hypothetical protein